MKKLKVPFFLLVFYYWSWGKKKYLCIHPLTIFATILIWSRNTALHQPLMLSKVISLIFSACTDTFPFLSNRDRSGARAKQLKNKPRSECEKYCRGRQDCVGYTFDWRNKNCFAYSKYWKESSSKTSNGYYERVRCLDSKLSCWNFSQITIIMIIHQCFSYFGFGSCWIRWIILIHLIAQG